MNNNTTLRSFLIATTALMWVATAQAQIAPTPAVGTILGAPASLAAASPITFIYNNATTKWWRK